MVLLTLSLFCVGDGTAEHAESGEKRGLGLSGGDVRAKAVGESLPPPHRAPAGDGPERQASLGSGKSNTVCDDDDD